MLFRSHILVSRALKPSGLMVSFTNNMTKPEAGSFVYFDSLNVVKNIVPTSPRALFNTSELASSLNESDLIYSNGNSEIWSGT